MTLAALWSRQGKLVLALAFLAATVALVGVSLFTNANGARADIPAGTTVTITQVSPTGGAVDIGLSNGATCGATQCVTYHVDIATTQAPSGTTTGTVFTIQPDPNLWFVGAANATGAWAGVSCLPAGQPFENAVDCHINSPIDDGTFDVTFAAVPYKDFSVGDPVNAGAACFVDDAGAGAPVDCTLGAPQSAFDVTINPWPVNPATAENGPGQDHTITFTLPAHTTCVSSVAPPGPINQAGTAPTPLPPAGGTAVARTCDATDVDVSGASATLISGPTVSDPTLDNTATVTVTINSATTGNVTVTLDTAFITQILEQNQSADTGPNSYDLIDPTAQKTYGLVAAGETGRIRHVDLPDKGTEDAADGTLNQEEQPYCDDVLAAVATNTAAGAQGGTTTPTATPNAVLNAVLGANCGVLNSQDDIDDAIGSFHGACLLGTLLTFTANNGDLTWHIEPVPPGSGPAPASVSTFGGQFDEPCVMWGAGTTGTQQIYVVYHEGEADETTFFFDTTPNLPLIKEWNTIDSTSIIGADGDVGATDDTLFSNTGDFADWIDRDCSINPAAPGGGDPPDLGFCDNANLDGLTMQQSGSIIVNASNPTRIRADGRGFIDYTMGHHADAGGTYEGPVDGAAQTYSVSGDCGSVRLEDPSTGDVIILNPGDSQDVLSSDKGVGFEILPNDDGDPFTDAGNADCGPNATICVDIDTIEDNLFHSPPLATVSTETICVTFVVGPPTSKTPLLAWAGQRVVLEHYWGDPATGDCFVDSTGSRGGHPAFGVQYSKQNGKGGFTAALVGSAHDVDQTNDDVIVHVNIDAWDDNHDGITDPNSNCTSRALYESEDQTEADISAYVVNDNDDVGNSTPQSQQVPFVVYFMKFEDFTLGIVPEDSGIHGGPSGSPSQIQDSSDDVTDITANVSSDVLARARVRGWVDTDNCPARDSGIGENGEFLPANRCIFPDDWAFKAGGKSAGLNDAVDTASNGVPEESRPNFEINKAPSRNHVPNTNTCQTLSGGAAGPFSLLDGLVTKIEFGVVNDGASLCDDSLAPLYPADGGASANCLTGGLTYNCRETVLPDGIIDAWDAPMPPALVRFLLTGSGFLTGADKADVYSGNSNPFYDTHIPAEPWIDPINADLEGYQWNSWGGAGGKSGPYHFWTSLADHGPEVVSCAGSGGGFIDPNDPAVDNTDSDPCPGEVGVGVATGGYKLTKVYTDNHGEAFTWVNGDADLSFDDCDSSTPTENDHDIVLLNGFFCELNDVVGNSTLGALVDYPDKRKHFAELSNEVTMTWTWGGIKEVTVVPDPADNSGQFNYVVFHVTDRDGFCGDSNSLHPVLGEEVRFRIDSTTGVIVPDVNGNDAEGPASSVSGDGKQATTHTFDTAVNDAITDGGITVEPVSVDGECQAWIHVSESLLNPVNVIVTAFDPEGTVTFDTTEINPTPTPSPVPTEAPTPTPFTLSLVWGDSDCDGNVAPRDGQAILKHFLDQSELSQSQPCPAMGERVMVSGNEVQWGDWDCNGAVAPRDGQAGLKHFLSQAELSQTEPCSDIGANVEVQPIVP
jgi:hypothetical protein